MRIKWRNILLAIMVLGAVVLMSQHADGWRRAVVGFLSTDWLPGGSLRPWVAVLLVVAAAALVIRLLRAVGREDRHG